MFKNRSKRSAILISAIVIVAALATLQVVAASVSAGSAIVPAHPLNPDFV
jgi:hypothetical protein